MSKVYIEHRETKYPTPTYGYAPSKRYPEYQWDDISGENNEVYDMVRDEHVEEISTLASGKFKNQKTVCAYQYNIDNYN